MINESETYVSPTPDATSEDLSLHRCLDVLGIKKWPITTSELMTTFGAMTRLYHPDTSKDEGSYRKYIEITQSYQYLKNLLVKSPVHRFQEFRQILPPQESTGPSTGGTVGAGLDTRDINAHMESDTNSYFSIYSPDPISIKQSKGLLEYVVKVNFLDMFYIWNQNLHYKKIIRYVFDKFCTCELLCNSCKGSGTLIKLKCTECRGRGWVNFCSECNGTGSIKQNDLFELILPVNKQIARYVLVHSKGAYYQKNTRGDLLLKINNTQDVVSLNNNRFIYTYAINASHISLSNTSIQVPFYGSSINVDMKKIKRIPYYQDISHLFPNVQIDNKPVQIILRLILKT